MKIYFFLLLLLSFPLSAFETVVEADEVRYNGEYIVLSGNVSIENSMGIITAEKASLKKDTQRITKIDFPWIELKNAVRLQLADGGVLCCDTLFLDYTQMTSFFYGTPQVSYKGALGEIYADKAQVDYLEVKGKLEAKKVTLFENVRLINHGSEDKPASQYALAEEVSYYPQEQLAFFTGNKTKVLFYDALRDMQLSACSVKAQRDPITKKETIQGIGDVQFVFGPEEFEKIKQRFPNK